MILVHQRYYAKPGMAAAVLATRRRADRRLRELDLPVGQTYTCSGGQDDAPDVVWECTYATMADREHVESILDHDPAFTAIRAEQSAQLARFAREYYETDDR